MSKRNFDNVVTDNLAAIDKKAQSKQAVEAFESFNSKVVPVEVNAYEWEDSEVLIEVFSFQPEDELTLQVNGNGESLGNMVYLPIAKVLASGEGSKYSVGDVIKLRDSDVTTVENPDYREWVHNKLSKSNLKQKGDEPVRYGSNIVKTLGPFLFTLNPLKRDDNLSTIYFKISDAKVENKIKDVQVLLTNI